MSLPLFPTAFSAWRVSQGLDPDGCPHFDSLDAVVKLSIKTVPEARTSEHLGAEREGTGVVIGEDGLILTIGYLVLEADSVLVVTRDGRVFPATPVGFDHATGFALLRSSPRVASEPLAFGRAADLRELHHVTIATHPAAGGTTCGYVVSRRLFTGYWEYMLDDAIFTAPPRFEHSGAALIDPAGRLAGIGSLWVGDALDSGHAFPGNMFVPTDLLEPVLAEIVQNGRRRGPARPWIGMYSEEIEGHVVVTRVLPEAPADAAGLKRGDVILGVGPDSISGQADLYRRLWATGPAGVDIDLHFLRDRSVRRVKVQSTDRLEYLRPRPVY